MPEVGVRYLLIARAELNEIVSWYDAKRPGLGVRFIEKVDRSIDFIRQFPEGFNRINDRVRFIAVSKFPYRIVYRVAPTEVVILSVKHDRRKAGVFEAARPPS